MKSVSPSAATGTSTLGRLLDIEQLTRTLAFLAGYRPGPWLRLDGRMTREDGPEPYCTACGEPAGIFLGHGPDWHHFRALDAGSGGSASASAEVYAADHAPAIGWRYTTPTPCADSTCPDQSAT
jgi:hypothetical protein